jgi:2-succinyl-6-hydroxy-2,4-cyclohexadiene-1-carboxylate synthase
MSPVPEPMNPTQTSHMVGVSLHAEVMGNGPRTVMAHGFTQTCRVWGSMDSILATDHELMLVDMPGHGGSAHVLADLTEGAHLLGALGGNAAYLGYSMGARFCLHLALTQPELVSSLVLISGTAGIDDPDDRAARRAQDEGLADQLDPPLPGGGGADSSGGGQARLDSFLRRWLDNPLLSGAPTETDGFAERRRNTGPGLASSLRLAGTGTQLPLWAQLNRLTMPVLILTGEHDDKFTGLGRRMADAIGENATHVVIAGVGHSPHLQQPALVAEQISAHLGSGR